MEGMMAKNRKSAFVASGKNLDDIFTIKEQAAFVGALTDRVHERWNRIGFDELTPGEKLIIRLNAFVGEINTNGFDGLLFNCTGDWIHEIHDDLLLLGAKNAAELVKEAMSVFPGGRVPKDESSRKKVLRSFKGKKKATYDALMDKLSAAIDKPAAALDLPKLVSRYARKRRPDFED
jgi:hypothetical protein